MKNTHKIVLIIGAVALVAALLLYFTSAHKPVEGFFGLFNALMDIAIAWMLFALLFGVNFLAFSVLIKSLRKKRS